MVHSILVVDDEKDIVDMLERYFSRQGYEVISALSGKEALEKIGRNPDIILLDINLPDIDGWDICQRIRGMISCPIIFLTARVEDNDKIKGFALGGDDYVVKPFSIDELGARIAAHLRREMRHAAAVEVRFDENLAINYSERLVTCNGEEIPFARKEFDIIELLSQHIGQIFDRERIYESIWGLDGEGDSSVVTEHIRRIRCKLSAYGSKSYIETVWGCGYKWVK